MFLMNFKELTTVDIMRFVTFERIFMECLTVE